MTNQKKICTTYQDLVLPLKIHMHRYYRIDKRVVKKHSREVAEGCRGMTKWA